MAYVVYVNHPTNRATVHRAECRYHVHRKARKTRNGYWSCALGTLQEALSYAHSTGKATVRTCKVCIKPARARGGLEVVPRRVGPAGAPTRVTGVLSRAIGHGGVSGRPMLGVSPDRARE